MLRRGVSKFELAFLAALRASASAAPDAFARSTNPVAAASACPRLCMETMTFKDCTLTARYRILMEV